VTGPGAGFGHPFSPAGQADPHATWRGLRERAPVWHDPMTGMWLLTGYAGCARVVRDRAFSAALGQQGRTRSEPLPATMLNTDGAEHDRLRAPAAALLGPAAVRTVMAPVAAGLDRIVAGLTGSAGPVESTVDISAALGEPAATAVLGLLFGVPAGDWPLLAGLARRASANLDPVAPPAAQAAGAQGMALLNSFLDRHLSTVDAVGTPMGDFLADGRLTRREQRGVVALIIVGGWRPLAEFAGNALHLLLPHPDVRARLRAGDAELAASTVDEVLRMEAPIPFLSRVATEPVELPGGTVPAGGRVLALLSAANRDPAVFADPDTFHADRAPNPHLGLGGGGHYCLGALLLRRAGAHLLTALLRTYPGLTADPAPVWAATMLPRALARYQVTLDPAGVAVSS
jgi:cytochrome P450